MIKGRQECSTHKRQVQVSRELLKGTEALLANNEWWRVENQQWWPVYMVNPLSPHGVHKHHAASAATEYIRIYVTLSFYTNISGYPLDKSTHPLDDEPTSLKQTTNKNLIWQSLSLNKDDLHLDIVHTYIMRSIRYKVASKCLLEKNWK